MTELLWCLASHTSGNCPLEVGSVWENYSWGSEVSRFKSSWEWWCWESCWLACTAGPESWRLPEISLSFRGPAVHSPTGYRFHPGIGCVTTLSPAWSSLYLTIPYYSEFLILLILQYFVTLVLCFFKLSLFKLWCDSDSLTCLLPLFPLVHIQYRHQTEPFNTQVGSCPSIFQYYVYTGSPFHLEKFQIIYKGLQCPTET